MVLRYRRAEGAPVGGLRMSRGSSGRLSARGEEGEMGVSSHPFSRSQGLDRRKRILVCTLGGAIFFRSFLSGTQSERVEVNLSGGVACFFGCNV